jgi:radical SAM protein with 4Fe4S-binding SPASM domain
MNEYQDTLPFPLQVYIETTNVCNLHCSGCPRDVLRLEQEGNYTEHRHLTREEYSGLIGQIAAESSCDRPIRLKLFFMDEPLAHKDVAWQVALAKSHPGLSVNITTNGSLLRQDKAQALIEAGIDELAISVDAVSPDLYERVRGGGNNSLGRIIDNIYGTVKIRNSLGAQTRIYVTMVAHPGEDWERQYEALQVMWGHLVDFVAYRPFSEYRGDPRPPLPGFCCSEPFERMFLRADGAASLCTEDVRPDMVVGDWRNQSLRDIWVGAAYQRIRHLHKSGRYHEIDLCSRCHVPFDTED